MMVKKKLDVVKGFINKENSNTLKQLIENLNQACDYQISKKNKTSFINLIFFVKPSTF